MSRPLLVGLHNPISPEPEFALYPRPHGCTGWHLQQMLRPAFHPGDYLRAFDRIDLLEHHEQVGGKGYTARLRRAHWRMLEHIIDGKYETVVLLGADVWRAMLGVPKLRPPWLCWRTVSVTSNDVGWQVRFLTLPHPSGRNPWYRNPANKAATSRALQQVALVGFKRINETPETPA